MTPPATNKQISLRDIANMARVSIGTASRALSRPDMVKADTRERILKMARQSGYVMNGAARALVKRKSFTVGALIPRFGTAAFSTMLQTLESSLAEGGYKMLLSMPEDNRADDPTHIRTLLEAGVDALALLGSQQSSQSLSLLLSQSIPIVTMWSSLDGPLPGIKIDEMRVSALIIEHLAKLGHKNIGFIGGISKNNERAAQRLIGIHTAASRYGMRLSADALIETLYGFSHGFVAAQQLIARNTGITAIVCGNDYLATGVISALQQSGIRVPEDISVTGINNNDFAPYLCPPLTTVNIPLRGIGAESGRYLLARLRGEHPTLTQEMPVELIVRKSTARIG